MGFIRNIKRGGIMNKEEIKEKLMKYFNINSNCDYYILTRDKSAFGYGTMTFNDFQEFDEEIINDIVNYLVGDSNEQRRNNNKRI